MILAILNPKPDRFEFERDSYKFIMGLSIVALLGFAFTVAIFLEHGVQPRRIIISALDLITIIIPPGLPLALTIGIAFANKRLKYYGISCIQLNAINTAGAVQVAVFDKTGTLT